MSDTFGSFFTKLGTTVNPGQAITFDQESFPPHGGLKCVLGTGNFVFAESGFYSISYGFAQSASNASIALTLDGTTVDGSQIFGNLAGQLTSANIIIPINALQILNVINISTGPFNLSSFPNNITASITIEKVKSSH